MKKSRPEDLAKRLKHLKRRIRRAESNLSNGKRYPIDKLGRKIKSFEKRLAFSGISIEEIDRLKGLDYKDYLQTKEWKEKSKAIRQFYGNRCALCNSSKNLNVHHRTYKNRGNELPEDLILLCNSCHKKFHGIVE